MDRGESISNLRSIPALVVNTDHVVRKVLWAAGFVLGLGLLRQVIVLIVGGTGAELGLAIINVDSENSLPAWFSSLLLIAGSAACAFMAHLARWSEPLNRRAWIALAMIFALMSLDEIVSLHESTADSMRQQWDLGGVFAFGWVAWALPLVAVLGALFLPFLRRLDRTTAVRICIAGAAYTSGALGMEMIGGAVYESAGYGNLYALCFFLEETGEIVGAVLFLRAVLLHIARHDIRLSIAPPSHELNSATQRV